MWGISMTTLAFADPIANTASAAPTLRSARAKIDTIDLSMVKLKLMDPEEGKGWTQVFADLAEERYRRFLTLLYLNRDGSIVPTQDVDNFWHQHILDTRAYAADCERVFGEFIHHFPYFGMRGDADAQNLLSSFEATKAVYADAFGEPYCLDGLGEAAGKCVKCGSGPYKCHHQPARCR
jgi:hypothetical protein